MRHNSTPLNGAGAMLVFTLAACDMPGSSTEDSDSARWYTPAQVAQGEALFQRHCAVCHGEAAQGNANWSKRDASGNFPPPPLDDTAHAWHHPLVDLQKVIRNGGVAYGGTMPPFGDTLSDEEIRNVIAFFQQTWSDEIYQRWTGIDAASRGTPASTTTE